MKKPKIKWVCDLIAKKLSYGNLRLKKNIKGIIIHNTGNAGDTAKNNVMFFSRQFGGNTRNAGAHFFIDQEGNIGRSIPMNRSAYSVGNPGGCYAPGTYYNTLNNTNTVSIELCDIMTKEPSEKMIEACVELVRYIKAYCPNVEYICRHYDVVKKDCPHRFVKNEKEWHKFRARLKQEI